MRKALKVYVFIMVGKGIFHSCKERFYSCNSVVDHTVLKSYSQVSKIFGVKHKTFRMARIVDCGLPENQHVFAISAA